jgi:hypothetical protein
MDLSDVSMPEAWLGSPVVFQTPRDFQPVGVGAADCIAVEMEHTSDLALRDSHSCPRACGVVA